MALRRFVFAVLCLVACYAAPSPAHAQELLQNGGFEQGMTAWLGTGIATSGCQPQSGSLALSFAAGTTAFAQQNVEGPLSAGAYSLHGWLKTESGSPRVNTALIWLDVAGAELARTSGNVIAGSAYAAFSLAAEAPAGAHSLRVRFAPAAGSATLVCLDAVSLDGPAQSQATPLPQPSPTSTPSPSSTPEATSAPAPAAAAKPANTPATTRSAVQATATTQPTRTPTPVGTAAAPAGAVRASGAEPTPTPPALQPATAEVLAATVAALPSPLPLAGPLVQAASGDSGVPLVWLAAGLVFVAALAGSYLHGKRRNGA